MGESKKLHNNTIPISTKNIVIDDDFKRAFDVMENTQDSILLTGRAGTGKSTLLTYFREQTKKQIAVVAFTGVAALNIKAQTIHSFFGFGVGVTPQTVPVAKNQRMFKKLQTLVIDEISMVRADLLDCIDAFLRKNGPDAKKSFGGIQMIFIGDLYQLPPVVPDYERPLFQGIPYRGPYFFHAHVFTQPATHDFNLRFIELTHMRRQHQDTEATFISILNAMRENVHTREHVDAINIRHDPTFDEYENSGHVILVTTNDMARHYNSTKLEQISSDARVFEAEKTGRWGTSTSAERFPTDETLVLKIGAQVMLLHNDIGGRWVNGDIGTLIGFVQEKDTTTHEQNDEQQVEDITYIADEDGYGTVRTQTTPRKQTEDDIRISVQLANGTRIRVGKYTWERIEYTFNAQESRIDSKTTASFTQFPLKLAWSSTIHKAQGKTFDRVVINFGRGAFAHGQAYVALSRTRTMDGITLKTPIRMQDIRVDDDVVQFMKRISKK